ncbi:CheR family methyltransferase [Streptosporangium vulgare]|uniref:CheR family methyltransferase n=1 Tax=Streptosporangium vulgare TaxID=46190 RepID=UPI0031D2C1E1
MIPSLLASKGPGKVVRIWSTGCATGEEAYSLAMVLAEELGMDEFRERVKIYATDLDQKALQTARAAVYGERQLADVPEELRRTYFEPVEAGFGFRRDLRRQLIFGRNDLTRDAPISRVDLLLARNTLMYFNSETQLSIVRRFHFALSDPGYLFLGKAEMLLNHGDRFEPVNLRMRLFKKIGSPPPGSRATWSPGAGVSRARPYVRHTVLQAAALATGPVAQIALDRSRNLALANSRAELLFNLNPRDIGRPFQDLEVSYRPVELRSVIEQVELDLRVTELQDVTWHRPNTPEPSVFDIAVVPLLEPGGELVGVGVNFHDVTRYRQLHDRLEQTNRELEHAYEELQSTNEELETTNEELQSTNEELETTNEELQSTNEELETMNEELQSTNDELQQINDTLNSRSDELKRATLLVSSVVRSLGDAVAVVDTDLRVLVWSPGAEELWGAPRRRGDRLPAGLPRHRPSRRGAPGQGAADAGGGGRAGRRPRRRRHPGRREPEGTPRPAQRRVLPPARRRHVTPWSDHGDEPPPAGPAGAGLAPPHRRDPAGSRSVAGGRGALPDQPLLARQGVERLLLDEQDRHQRERR